MRWHLLLVLGLLLPALSLPALAADENRVGYLSLEGVSIELQGPEARIEVDYTLDPGMQLILLLLGTGDLQRKLERSLNFPSLKAEEVGPTRAVFTLEDATADYGDRAYWFPPHSFGATFPRVTVEAPGYSQSYTRTRSIPKGFGYFWQEP
jgi:hypothetical protein